MYEIKGNKYLKHKKKYSSINNPVIFFASMHPLPELTKNAFSMKRGKNNLLYENYFLLKYIFYNMNYQNEILI